MEKAEAVITGPRPFSIFLDFRREWLWLGGKFFELV
jgi:hypothetical protein